MKKLKTHTRFFAVFFVFAFFSNITAKAQEPSINNLYHTVLENGLELFVLEDSSVSTSFIELSLRVGNNVQDSKTAGLINVYNRMLLKGNNLYKTPEAFQKALENLEITNLNCSTENEYTKFSFTVQSQFSKLGLDFLSTTMREPLFDKIELESEKKVVISEISKIYKEPNNIFAMGVAKALFSKYPWRLDSFGSVKNIQAATVEQLRTIQQTYYVPNNAALFIGGNITYDDVYKMVQEIYGTWKKSDNLESAKRDCQLAIPAKETQFLVMPHAQISPEIAQVTVLYRGPDTATDAKSTYAADTFTALSKNPTKSIKQTLIAIPELKIPAPDFIHCNYHTQQESGTISFTALMRAPEKSIAQQAQLFQNTIQTQIVEGIINNTNYFTEKEYADFKQELLKKSLYTVNSISDFLDRLCFWWASSNTNYFFNYYENMKLVTSSDISDFAKKYLKDKPAIVTVLVNPAVYELQKDQFSAAGFTTITEDNAYWWLF